MCDCLSFLLEHPVVLQRWNDWRRVVARLCVIFQSSPTSPPVEVEVFCEPARAETPASPGSTSSRAQRQSCQKTASRSRKMGVCMLSDGAIFVVTSKQERSKDGVEISTRKSAKLRRKDSKKLVEMTGMYGHETLQRFIANGGSTLASLFTQQGLKGINQDAMLVVENFVARADTIFCGVFDGHGSQGHLVSRTVRDALPLKLASAWQASRRAIKERSSSVDGREADSVCQQDSGCPGKTVTAWKDAFFNAYKLMDRELLVDDQVDCVSSGTTAVTLVKQGNHLIIGNVGDSRAVLGTGGEDNSIQALQLTVDLKPSVPKEAERIRRLHGRIFALREEPLVKRVWLPNHNKPGLAMARSLGDYCLKNYGVISEPEVFYRRLTKKDKFIVLATDGVWDVLSNQQVVETVASVPMKSLAAKAVVDSAVNIWRSRHPTSRVDDCAVVCLFLDDSSVVSSEAVCKNVRSHSRKKGKGGSYTISRQTTFGDL